MEDLEKAFPFEAGDAVASTSFVKDTSEPMYNHRFVETLSRPAISVPPNKVHSNDAEVTAAMEQAANNDAKEVANDPDSSPPPVYKYRFGDTGPSTHNATALRQKAPTETLRNGAFEKYEIEDTTVPIEEYDYSLGNDYEEDFFRANSYPENNLLDESTGERAPIVYEGCHPQNTTNDISRQSIHEGAALSEITSNHEDVDFTNQLRKMHRQDIERDRLLTVSILSPAPFAPRSIFRYL